MAIVLIPILNKITVMDKAVIKTSETNVRLSKKSDIKPMPEYFERYIHLVGDVDLTEAFEQSIRQIEALDKNLLERLEGRTYAPDKWTVKGIFQHIIDFERILSYRALLFARREGSIPQGVDENLLGANMDADRRTIDDLIEELKIVRLATKSLFESFDGEALHYTGISWKYEISVLGMAFLIVGHQIHHFKVIEEKYFPLAGEN